MFEIGGGADHFFHLFARKHDRNMLGNFYMGTTGHDRIVRDHEFEIGLHGVHMKIDGCGSKFLFMQLEEQIRTNLVLRKCVWRAVIMEAYFGNGIDIIFNGAF